MWAFRVSQAFSLGYLLVPFRGEILIPSASVSSRETLLGVGSSGDEQVRDVVVLATLSQLQRRLVHILVKVFSDSEGKCSPVLFLCAQ